MFNSAVLDVAIGMIFVFLLVSFGVTSGNELLSSALRWRATNLALGIRQLLGDTRLSKTFYQHALIRSLHRDHEGDNDKLKPSHIPARLFATALLDLALKPADASASRVVGSIEDVKAAIRGNQGVLGEHATTALLALADHAESDTRIGGGTIERLQDDVEHWFNGAMDRCGGLYKRRTQLSSLVIALVICLFVNVDSIRIARVLANNPVLRASLIAHSEKRGAAALPAPSAAPASPAPAAATEPARETGTVYQDMQRELSEVTDLGIPMGWGSEIAIPTPPARGWLMWWIYKVGGILLTAMAASLGAPFWFDLLQKVLGLREAIKPPAGTPSAARD